MSYPWIRLRYVASFPIEDGELSGPSFPGLHLSPVLFFSVLLREPVASYEKPTSHLLGDNSERAIFG